MKVTKDMLDEGLRGRYVAGRVMTFLMHRRWFSPLALRIGRTALRGKNIQGLACEERQIPSRSGGPPIRTRIYRPLNATKQLPIMLYLHGGGYVHGVPEQFSAVIKDFIEAEPCIVVAPDYRKASEAPYPAAFDDCYDTLLWMKGNAASIGGRADKFIVAGHSAGGGLAAAVSLKATDTDDVQIAFQMPIYPMIDDRQNSQSMIGNDAPMWDEKANRLAWCQYLNGLEVVPPYAAPARCTDYRRLPPTITYVGSIEPFRDETIAYVENLRRANVPVEFEVFDGAYHAFDGMAPEAAISKRAKQFLITNYQRFVRQYLDLT